MQVLVEVFDVDRHINRRVVPAPGRQRSMDEVIADIAGEQLDRTRPLWQMWVLEGMADGSIAFVTKIHHAVADGVTGGCPEFRGTWVAAR